MAVDGNHRCRRRAELIVEDLERKRSVVSDLEQGGDELRKRQLALARHVAEVPAPGEVVHLDNRRVGKLHDEYAGWIDLAQALHGYGTRQRVKAVEDQAERRMTHFPDHRPGIPMIEHVPAPGERLVADPQVPPGGTLGELAEVGYDPASISARCRRDVGAEQQLLRPQLLHQIELSLQPVEGPPPQVVRHSLEIPKGLEERAGESEIAHLCRYFPGAAARRQQVVLENLGAVEFRLR